MRLFFSASVLLVFSCVAVLAYSTPVSVFKEVSQLALGYGSLAESPIDNSVPTSTATVLFVGDVLLGRDVERIISKYGFAYPFAAFDWPTADYVFANFEASFPAVHQPTPNGGMSFSVSSTSAEALQTTPITHLSLANNHAYDSGKSGFNQTRSQLAALGYLPFGDQFINEQSAAYLDVAGVRVAVLGLYALYNDLDLTALSNQLATMNETADVQLVYVHWGDEYELVHSPAQRELAAYLSTQGVDIIIGHHPHVVQDIEYIHNTLVIYSLGNFLFDQYFNEAVQRGLMVGVTFRSDEMAIDLYGVTSEGSRSQPRRMAAHDNALFLRQVADRSHPSVQSEIKIGRITMPLATLSND